jgi:hypothetical protein
MTDDERKAWLAIRKEAGLKIDPETAEVEWTYGNIGDPYGVKALPEDCIGRIYFARSPGSDVWVDFDDLPDATRDALWDKHKSKLAFPAGLWLPVRPASPKGEDGFAVYGKDQGELRIKGEGWLVEVRIELLPKLIEKLNAAVKWIETEVL